MYKNYFLILFFWELIVVILITSCGKRSTQHEIQTKIISSISIDFNEKNPELFAPGIISTGLHEHSHPSFSPDLKHVLWTSVFISNYSMKFPTRIIYSKNENGLWTEPEFFSAVPTSDSYEAFYSPDGTRIYFTSTDLLYNDTKGFGKQDIWYIEYLNSEWSLPINVGIPINSGNDEFMATVTQNNKLYYVGYLKNGNNNYGIYSSEYINGSYHMPKLLPENINSKYLDWCPFIDKEEYYLLFSSNRPGGYGGLDLYISYRNNDGSWQNPINLGETINSKWNEKYPYIKPDGNLLFFTSDRVNEGTSFQLDLSQYKDMYNTVGNGWGDIYCIKVEFVGVFK